MVANISHSFAYDVPVDDAALVEQIRVATDNYGIKVVVAAGNYSAPAPNYLPGAAPRAITIGMSSMYDDAHLLSNYGAPVAFYAPGAYVEAAHYSKDNNGVFIKRSEDQGCVTYAPYSCTTGTSFSAPFAAGIVARYLQTYYRATRDQVVAGLQQMNVTYSGTTIYEPQTGRQVPLLVINDCF